MRISKKHKFVFISTPKAGTNTIYQILNDHYSRRLLEAGFHNNQIVDGYGEYYRWTIVRNPFDRAMSIWWSACRLAHKDQYKFRENSGGQYDFTKFIKWLAAQSFEYRQKDPLMLNQSEWLGPVEPIHALHLENLEEELKQLPFWNNTIKIPQLNTTDEKIEAQSNLEGCVITRPTKEQLYTEEAIEAVLNWSDIDFERFGYGKEL